MKTAIFIISFLSIIAWAVAYLRIKEKSNIAKSALLVLLICASLCFFVTGVDILKKLWLVRFLLSSVLAAAVLVVSKTMFKIKLFKQWDYYVYLAVITASVLVTGYICLVGWALSSIGPLYH